MENSRMRRMRNNNNQDYQSVVDCFFFTYFGTCGFDPYCKFNHPVSEHPRADQEAITRTNAPRPCKYFLSGKCRFGRYCKYDHSFATHLLNYSLHFNALGFPKRWGMPDCSFFMRYGTCGYGIACKFHHPEPVFYYPEQEYYGSYVGEEVVEYQNGYAGINNGWNGWNQNNVTITIKEPCVTLNDVGLPLRPGKRVCRNYENDGRCRFGKGCKFDHPQ